MYSLYKEACATESQTPVSLSIYRRTFDHEYNIGFHHPIKDQCDFCISFKHAPVEQRVSMTDTIETHLVNKRRVREEKDRDKNKAKTKKRSSLCMF